MRPCVIVEHGFSLFVFPPDDKGRHWCTRRSGTQRRRVHQGIEEGTVQHEKEDKRDNPAAAEGLGMKCSPRAVIPILKGGMRAYTHTHMQSWDASAGL